MLWAWIQTNSPNASRSPLCALVTSSVSLAVDIIITANIRFVLLALPFY
jgi:hypothetical protein